MTTFDSFGNRHRDLQDLGEMHVWGRVEYINGAGGVIRVRGTGTEDIEAPILNIGQGHNYPDNENAEVLLISTGSDTNRKFALLTIPRDKQRPWAANTGGVQNPTDPNKALEFNGTRAWLIEDRAAVGRQGQIEVVGNDVFIRGNLHVTGTLTVAGDVEVGETVRSIRGMVTQGNIRADGGMTAPVYNVAVNSVNFNFNQNVPGFP